MNAVRMAIWTKDLTWVARLINFVPPQQRPYHSSRLRITNLNERSVVYAAEVLRGETTGVGLIPFLAFNVFSRT